MYLYTDGHNEAEFGMSWCAGFGGSFYNSYFEVSSFLPYKYKTSKRTTWPLLGNGTSLEEFYIGLEV